MFAARSRAPSPKESTSSLELSGLAVHPEFRGFGIATMLVTWGLDHAARANIPVFTAGEERGVNFYTNALGFRRLPKNEYWLDSNGNSVSREEIEGGNESWKTENGGLSGCELVWCPEGVLVDDDGYLLTV
jgi:GNAT superfamily N-acetyltransferase